MGERGRIELSPMRLMFTQLLCTYIQETERDPSSYRLELDGYLSKPTARLGRYTLFLDAILKHTPPDNPDRINIPKATDIIKQFLTRVNEENGKAKNRFDLERIDQKLLFKSDKVVRSRWMGQCSGGGIHVEHTIGSQALRARSSIGQASQIMQEPKC